MLIVLARHFSNVLPLFLFASCEIAWLAQQAVCHLQHDII
jgi:hypothetical protein